MQSATAPQQLLLWLMILLGSVTTVNCLNASITSYVGCVHDVLCDNANNFYIRIFPDKNYVALSNSMTREWCEDYAIQNGWRYWAVQFGKECWFGDDICKAQTFANECNMPCSGDKTQMCGGICQMDIFYTALPGKELACPGLPGAGSGGAIGGNLWQRCCDVQAAGGGCNSNCSQGWESDTGSAGPTSTCNSNATAGFWDAPNGTCVPSPCRQPPPSNAIVGVAWKCSLPTAHNAASCVSGCLGGFYGSGFATSSCSFGQWTVDNQCKPLPCTSQPTQAPPTNSHPFNCKLPAASGTSCYSSCFDGYEGNGWAQCYAGSWTSFGGSCTKQSVCDCRNF